jgi:Uma2 family endonuclease
MGRKAGLVGGRLHGHLGLFVLPHQLGELPSQDVGYRVVPGAPNRAYYPDGSFVRRGRWPRDSAEDTPLAIAPDLMFEVVSPSDTAEELDQKVEAFLAAGTRLVWVVYPETRTIKVFRPGSQATRLTLADELSGEDVLPGFTCKLAALFDGV